MQGLVLIAAVVLATFPGCTKPLQKPTRTAVKPLMPPYNGIEPSPNHQPAVSPAELPSPLRVSLPSRSAIVDSATRLVGAQTITSQGRSIAYDCAGVTRAIFLQHGIDLYRGHASDGRVNGVRLIHDHVRQHGVLHQGSEVHPGDLVFFDNTWDFNGDGRLNDPLTHVGIVEELEPDGTVVFISRVTDSIARYRMNLSHPHLHKAADGRVLNDYIRRKRSADPPNTVRLTGELFSSYGNLLSPLKTESLDNRSMPYQNQPQISASSPSGNAER